MPTIYPTQDWLTAGGAKSLANKIKRYWDARGYQVSTMIEPGGPVDADGNRGKGTFYSVRSDLANGFPRRKATS
jgi:hypothetical protein